MGEAGIRAVSETGDDDDDAFDALMVELRAEFRATLAGHDAAIAGAWAIWVSAAGADEREGAFRSLLAVAHKLWLK